jgi:predicted ATPase
VHFEHGRAYQRAIPYYQHAAQNAMRRSANQEAIDYLQQGLSLLQHLPETPERTQQELQLQVALSTPLLLTKGYTAPEVEQVCHRARFLCSGAEDSPQIFPAVFALFRFYIQSGKLAIAQALAEQMLRIAQKEPDSLLLPAAHLAVGGCLFHGGNLQRFSVE